MNATSILQELRRPVRGNPDWLGRHPDWLDASLRVSAADTLDGGDPLPMCRWLAAHVDELIGFDDASQTLREETRPRVARCADLLCGLVYPFGGASTPEDVHDVAVAFWRAMYIVFCDHFPGGPRDTRESLERLASSIGHTVAYRTMRAPGMLADTARAVLTDGGLLRRFDTAVLTATSETVHLLAPDTARTMCATALPEAWTVIEGRHEPATCARCRSRRERHPARQTVEDPAKTLAEAFQRVQARAVETVEHLLRTGTDPSREGMSRSLCSVMARQIAPELAGHVATILPGAAWQAIAADKRRLHPHVAAALVAACDSADPYRSFVACLGAKRP